MNNRILLLLFIISALLMGQASCNDDGEPIRSKFSIEGDLSDLNLNDQVFKKSYNITSNSIWAFSVQNNPSWITITPSSGRGDATIEISVDANLRDKRSAIVDIIINDQKRQQIVINQTGANITPPLIDEFPIIAWTGLSLDKKAEGLTSMKEAGFNIYLGWFDDISTTLDVLNEADKAGMKMITSSPELSASTEATVNQMKDHAALYGYYIDDEPGVSEFAGLSTLVKKIQTVDVKHPCYINLYPNWAWGKDNYLTNVSAFVDQVPVTFISFDNYPIVQIDGNPSVVRTDWYRNLEEIYTVSKNTNLPFWGFALALSHRLNDSHFYPIPSIEDLRLQVFSNLAYGAQCIQYFTYWGIYQDAPTNVYSRVKTVNEEIQSLSNVFLGAEVVSVAHTGSEIPEGTTRLNELPSPIKSLTTGDEGAVVSHLKNNGKNYLVLVNHSHKNAMDLQIEVDDNVQQILKDGTVAASVTKETQVPAGDIVIYTW